MEATDLIPSVLFVIKKAALYEVFLFADLFAYF